jgi:hypothetical protein
VKVTGCERCARSGVECPGFPGEEEEEERKKKKGKAAVRACARCRQRKAACVRRESCARCEKKGIECTMA